MSIHYAFHYAYSQETEVAGPRMRLSKLCHPPRRPLLFGKNNAALRIQIYYFTRRFLDNRNVCFWFTIWDYVSLCKPRYHLYLLCLCISFYLSVFLSFRGVQRVSEYACHAIFFRARFFLSARPKFLSARHKFQFFGVELRIMCGAR